MSKRLLLLPCIALLSALVLAACGGGSSEESQIEEAIEKSVTSTDPADCDKLETQKFMEQTTRESGAAAVKKCEEEAENEEGAESVAVSGVEVEGSSATAEAALTGGVLNGQAVEVALVKEGEQWKLDEAVKITKLDRAKLVEAFKQQLAKAAGELTPRLVACFVKAFEGDSQAEVEELLLSGSTRPLEEVAEACG